MSRFLILANFCLGERVRVLILPLLVLVLVFHSTVSTAFVSPAGSILTTTRQPAPSLFSSSSEDFELEDWRKFRASLIAKEETTTTTTMKQSVAKENEKLLEEQNEALAKEYKSEVWAHLISEPEVAGLICRMPIEGELYWGTGFWKDKLDALLKMDTMGPPETLMVHWFPMAERMLARELKVITAAASTNGGILNPKDLEPDARILLEKYLDYKQTWQEVCLMLGSTQAAVIINRPISKNINKQLATLLLEGQPPQSLAGGKNNNGNNHAAKYPFGFVEKFVQAFSSDGAVYLGGPDLQAEPALVVHGIAGLDGAIELAPGTGIYMGGLEAAVEGVLDGRYKPLDFRFFLGRKVFQQDSTGGSLKEKIRQGAYKPIACNRSLALKQCLGLPKPLWHEGKLDLISILIM
jgi:hypothetical protein